MDFRVRRWRWKHWTIGMTWALVWTAVLVVVGLWVGTRTFKRQNA